MCLPAMACLLVPHARRRRPANASGRVPIVPLHKKVSNGLAPKKPAQIRPIRNTMLHTTTAATAGVAFAPVLPRT